MIVPFRSKRVSSPFATLPRFFNCLRFGTWPAQTDHRLARRPVFNPDQFSTDKKSAERVREGKQHQQQGASGLSGGAGPWNAKRGEQHAQWIRIGKAWADNADEERKDGYQGEAAFYGHAYGWTRADSASRSGADADTLAPA